MNRERFWELWGKYGQTAVNVYLFLSFGIWCVSATYQTYLAGRLDALELSFVIPNFILAILFLTRKPHQAFCRSWFDQGIALVAFLSGLAIMGTPASGGEMAEKASWVVIMVANLLGIATLLNLGKSFGIFIAFRELRQSGLYGVIRHPMYLSDILLRVGYLIGHFQTIPAVIVVASTVCYVYRAILEERFLSKQPEYADYMTRVRYRFIPGLF
jgi:protein-S-isoprenylcysteine O-methyltransferase Ste14